MTKSDDDDDEDVDVSVMQTVQEGGGGDGGGAVYSGLCAIRHSSHELVANVTVVPDVRAKAIDTACASTNVINATSLTDSPCEPNNATLLRNAINDVAFTADPFCIEMSNGGTAAVAEVATDTTVGWPAVGLAGDVALVATFAGPEVAVGVEENADSNNVTKRSNTGAGDEDELTEAQKAPPIGIHSVVVHTDASDCNWNVNAVDTGRMPASAALCVAASHKYSKLSANAPGGSGCIEGVVQVSGVRIV